MRRYSLTLGTLALVLLGCTQVGWKTYHSSAGDMSFSYPLNFTLEENAQVVLSMETGSILHFPAGTGSGTTLSDARIEIISQANNCPELILATANTSSRTVVGIPFTVKQGTDVGAGNLYEIYSYETTHENICHRFALVLHSCNLGSDCGEGHTGTFDRQVFVKQLEDILSTLKFKQ